MKQARMLAGVFAVALAVAMCAAPLAMGQESSTPAAAPAAPDSSGTAAEAAPAPQSLAGALVQAKAVTDAMQQQLREKRLAVLKQLEAGEIGAEAALEALDKLPASPSRFKDAAGREAWLMVQVRQGDVSAFELMLPLSVVRWLISEGPKLLPKEMREELTQEAGYDITQIDLSGFIIALDALNQVTAPTPLFVVKNGVQEVSVTVLPMAHQAKP